MQPKQLLETNQYLTFNLNDEIFALNISQVREVLEVDTINKVPKMPSFMCGVINLRGNVVPVVDMSLKFGMPEIEKTVNTCIIIIEISIEKENVMLGAMVDSVKEVMTIDEESIEPPPKIGASLNTDFIRGMGKHNEEFIILLNLNKVFSPSELSLI